MIFKKLKNNVTVKKIIFEVINQKKSLIPGKILDNIDDFEDIVNSIAEYNDTWNKLPIIIRIAKVTIETSEEIIHKEIINLPDIHHDLDLVLKMLNHQRVKKQLKETSMSLFINTDELFLDYKNGKINYKVKKILFQLVIFFQNGSLLNLGLVADKEYVILFN